MKQDHPNRSPARESDEPLALPDLIALWRSLPVPVTPDLWPRLESRLRPRHRRVAQPLYWAGAAGAILLLAVLLHTGETPVPAPPSATAEVEALARLSGLLESEWRQQRSRRGIVSGAEIRRIDDLAALIGLVDEQLMPPPADRERARRLWRQRVVLMNELLAAETIPAAAVQQTRSETL